MKTFNQHFDSLRQHFGDRAKVVQALKKLFPILVWLRNYSLSDLRYDIVAGITVGMTMVPQSIAYVSMANLRPEAGLYSAFAGQFIYVLLGTSKDASIGPAAIVSMIVGHVCASANPLYDKGDPTCATILALFSGVILFFVGVFQFGFVVNLFSIPVVSGFTTAAGFTIAASQLAPLLGLQKGPYEMPGVFVKQLKYVCDNIFAVNLRDLTFGGSALAFLLIMQNVPRLVETIERRVCVRDVETGHRIKARSRRFVVFLEVIKFISACKNIIVFVVSTGVAYALACKYGLESVGVTLVGFIEPGIPFPSVPRFYIAEYPSPTPANFSLNTTMPTPEPIILKDVENTLADLTVGYIAVPVMCIMEMFAILKALGRKNGYRVDARQELMAVGLSNVVTAFLGGVPVTAAVTRCALNDQCHVRTQVGSIISALVVIVSISTLTSAFFYIPRAVLAAIIIVAALNLVDLVIIPDVWRHCRTDAFLLVFTILLCVFFEISYGVILCLSLNALILLRAVVHTQLHVTRKHPSSTFSFGDGEHPRSIAVCKLSHGLKYPSADKFLDKVAALLEKESHLIIDCTFVQSVDYTGVQAFRSLLLSAVQKGLHVVFANLNESVHNEFEKLGLDHFHHVSSVEAAIGEYNKAVVISEMEAASSTTVGDTSSQIAIDVTATSTADLVSTHPGLDHRRRTYAGSDDRSSAAAKIADDKVRRRLMRELSVQPHFYGDVPLMVGGNLDYGSYEGDDDVAESENAAFEDDEDATVSETDSNNGRSRCATVTHHHRAPHHEHRTHRRQYSEFSNSEGRPVAHPEKNIQFLNKVLLRQVSRNSSLRRYSTPRLPIVENFSRRNNEPQGAANAIAVISETPALEFIDIGSPERLSPVFERAKQATSHN